MGMPVKIAPRLKSGKWLVEQLLEGQKRELCPMAGCGK